jgi:hypothetical protein
MKWLTQNNVRSCVCSAANGSDILFLEALQSFEGFDARIVLPFPEDKFIEESVINGADESWVPRFREVLRRASRLTITDPITGLPKCTGTHVSRAARLEPKTPPNHVHASDAFTSLASEEGIAEFRCEFVKLMDWAKHYGTYPTYVVTGNG